MKPAFLAAALAASILSNAPAFAQTTTRPAVTADDLDLPAEREVILRECIIPKPATPW